MDWEALHQTCRLLLNNCFNLAFPERAAETSPARSIETALTISLDDILLRTRSVPENLPLAVDS
jgi:hypothetical protein